MNIFLEIILLTIPILYALTIHEFSHGWVAYKLGDPTAKLSGRLTLNPLKHLDPLGTLLLFVVKIGWAKPVPVNPLYFRNPRRDVAIVAFAGPLSNFVSAIIFGRLFAFLHISNLYLHMILYYLVYINLILAFFNLIPLAPLDGWKIAEYFLPPEPWVYTLRQSGPIILLIILLLPTFVGINPLAGFLNPLMNFGLKIATGGSF